MKRGWIFLLTGLLLAQACDSTSSIDPPDDSFFVKFYGTEGNQTGVDAVLNVDGTVTLFGTTESPTGKDLYLVNIEPNGRIVWERTYGGPEEDVAKDIELTNDGRLVVLADMGPVGGGDRDIKLMTLTLDGTKLDSSSTASNFGAASDEIGISVTQTNDGFLVAGSTDNLDLKPEATSGADTRDAIHIRYFDDLTFYPSTWRQAHGPGNFDEGAKIIQLPTSQIVDETQFYFFGYSDRLGTDFNPYILGLGVDGETTRDYPFLPGNPGTNEVISNVIISPVQSGEGFVLAGVTAQSASTAASVFIIKLRKTLSFGASDFQFQKNVADLGIAVNDRTSVFASANSGFLVLANDRSGAVQNFSLTKIGNDGNLVWDSPILFGGEMDDSIGSVLEFPDGSIGMVGTFSIGQDGETKMVFIKVNKNGKFLK